ncbi:pectinacetylesterase family protein [Halieaceae bacterium]|nr:pectinacetylesterase family protein [Halieaceae bacterium]
MCEQTKLSQVILASGLLMLAACSDSNNSSGGAVEPPKPEPVPFAELYDQGVDRYLGQYSPMLSETAGDIVNHAFGAGDGPLCLRGGEYTMATRDVGSDELVIFLQGGGACWSSFCAATEEAAPGIPAAGLLDPSRADNPTADWNTAYLPYCDGSVFSGDADFDDDGDGTTDRYQRGLKNLSAGLDVAANTFPAPSRILLTGISAGGFGTDYALPLVRKLYPGVPIELINDSGLGVTKPGFTEDLAAEWNAEAFIPESCPDCIDEDGHLTNYHKYQLDQDPDLRMGFMSTKQDTVIADVFVMIGGPAFEEVLLPEMQELRDAYPERFRSLIADGNQHTFLLFGFERAVGGTTVAQWVTDMLSGSDDWQSVSD